MVIQKSTGNVLPPNAVQTYLKMLLNIKGIIIHQIAWDKIKNMISDYQRNKR